MTPRSSFRPKPSTLRKPLAAARGDATRLARLALADTAASSAHIVVTAVIVHWGSPDPTVRLVRELGERTGIDKVIVVANDLRARPFGLPDSAIWLVPPRNLGFAGGFDFGCRSCPGAECYLLLNNDVKIDEACITECRHILGDESIGIVAPVLVDSGGLQSALGRVSLPLFKVTNRNYPGADRVCDADWVSGAVMFVRAACQEQVGFNLGYFLGFEDTDVCYRVRNSGWRVVVASHAEAWHQGGATIPDAGSAYYFTRNRIWFSRRWGSPLQACLVWLWIATVLAPRALVGDLIKRRGAARSLSVLHALVDGLKELPSENAVAIGEPYPEKWSRWT